VRCVARARRCTCASLHVRVVADVHAGVCGDPPASQPVHTAASTASTRRRVVVLQRRTLVVPAVHGHVPPLRAGGGNCAGGFGLTGWRAAQAAVRLHIKGGRGLQPGDEEVRGACGAGRV
jgi:hypothetical protein